MIQDMSDFRWPKPIKTYLTKRDWNKKCVYHKDHFHTTEQYRSLHYLVARLIKVGHLKQYICYDEARRETTQNFTTQVPTTSAAPKAIINYIHGGPVDEKYNSK